MKVTFIAEYTNKKKNNHVIWRDQYGKWYVANKDGFVKNRLNASEIVRYLANALEGK